MKKLLIILICALIVLTVAVAGLAFVFMANTRTDTTTEVAAEIAEIPWYEITADEQGGSVLTVRLPVYDRITRWEYEISDETLLELLTHETAGEYVASFRSFSPTPGTLTLTLTANNSSNSPVETRTLHLTVDSNKALTIR